METRLQQIRSLGVANYFGEQRFGCNGNNLVQAERWAKGEIAVKQRNKRGFYLSAVRSVIFNFIVSRRIQNNNKAYQIMDGDVMQLTGSGSLLLSKKSYLNYTSDCRLVKYDHNAIIWRKRIRNAVRSETV